MQQTTIQNTLMNGNFARSVGILWLAGVLGAIAVLPYTFALHGELLERATEESGLGLTAVVLISLVKNALVVAAAVAIGLFVSRRVGLSTPLVDRLFGAEQPLPRFVALAMAVGGMVGVAILALDGLVFQSLVPAELSGSGAALSWSLVWRGALASLYGAITEEIFFRLFLLALVAWSLRALLTREAKSLSPGVFWTANLLTALAFAAGHLPATAVMVDLTAPVVARALILNGIAGLACGWLFWRRGLEAAMLAHFSVDIVLHVAMPSARLLLH